jgi:hypothetical protein
VEREAEHPVESSDQTTVPSASAAPAAAAIASQARLVLALQRQAGNRAVSRLVRDAPARRLSRWPPSSWAGWSSPSGDAYDEFLDRVRAVRKRRRKPSEDELAEFSELRGRIAADDPTQARLRDLEHELVLWPKLVPGMDEIIEIVTGAGRLGTAGRDAFDQVDSALARFDESTGKGLKDALARDAEGFTGAPSCLSYLYASGVTRLFHDSSDAVEEAKERYWSGANERLKTTKRHAKTLSRLASELRLAGLVGPVRILRMRGRRHDPKPTTHFEHLTGGGPGWYFFLASLGSFHTLIVAVHERGYGRTYFKIQDGGTDRKTADELNEYFDEHGRIFGASTRIWPVYATRVGAREEAPAAAPD